jgi:acyl carrier protein
MVPSAFVSLERMPLTSNGKLDRRALPMPQREVEHEGRQRTPPQSGTEKELARIWEQVLEVEGIERDDSFFDLGGHSVSAMQATARIRAELDVEMPMHWMFEHSTVRTLAEQIDSQRQNQGAQTAMEGGQEMEDLLERVKSMSEGQVKELLGTFQAGGAR